VSNRVSTLLAEEQDFTWKWASDTKWATYKLTRSNTDSALSEFIPNKGFSALGVLQVNVSYGVEFDEEVIMTFMCLCDRISVRATNSIGWGANGFGGDF
jgi:hypothetical protein